MINKKDFFESALRQLEVVSCSYSEGARLIQYNKMLPHQGISQYIEKTCEMRIVVQVLCPKTDRPLFGGIADLHLCVNYFIRINLTLGDVCYIQVVRADEISLQ